MKQLLLATAIAVATFGIRPALAEQPAEPPYMCVPIANGSDGGVPNMGRSCPTPKNDIIGLIRGLIQPQHGTSSASTATTKPRS